MDFVPVCSKFTVMISEALSTYTESSLMITLIAVSCSTDNKQTKKHMPLKQYLDSCMDGGGISVAVIMNCVGFTARNGEREVLVWTYFPPLCILLPSPSPFPFCHSLSPPPNSQEVWESTVSSPSGVQAEPRPQTFVIF